MARLDALSGQALSGASIGGVLSPRLFVSKVPQGKEINENI
jgi:hypothetical protein